MRIIPLLISTIVFASVSSLSGQNCGCADEGNCPAVIPANNTTQICYNINDAFNNDLSDPAQGVCGVFVHFRHSRIAGLDMYLTAPDGTQVQLTGTNGFCNTFTVLTNWDILFLPCGETCEPDTVNNCALPCEFNNCPTDCPWPNAMLNGSYHPYSGCLEDFNTGPANGQWCLDIVNNAQFNSGSILDFEVILCDQSGFLCCKADAGNLAFEPNVSACEGDSVLQLTPNPLYGALRPDTNTYDYAYTVFSNGNLLAYDTVTDFRTYPAGTYQVCGLSYLAEDSLALPATGQPLTATELFDDLNGPAPGFCGDIDTNCIIVNIFSPPPLVNLTDTLCKGDTAYIGNEPYLLSGIYSDTIPSYGGCDSIVTLSLTVLDPDTTSLAATICNGEEYIVGQDTFSTSGMYEVSLENDFGCDSIVFLDLTVLPPLATNLTDTICQGDTLWVGATPFTTTGIFSETLLSFFNCDSVVNLDLTVVEVDVVIQSPDTLTCDETIIILSADGTTTTGTLNYQWTTNGGNFPSGNSAPNVGVDSPGIYYVTAFAGNCFATDSVEVIALTDPPEAIAIALSPDTLTCAVTEVTLDATTSTGGPDLSYEWVGGVSDPLSPAPFVNSPGTYQLIVTNSNNGCTDSNLITIFQDTLPPVADAGADTSLSCAIPAIFLNGQGSSPAGNLSYQWTANPGNILPPANTATPQINEPGTYELTVTNLFNACQDMDVVVVSLDSLTPQAIIDIPGDDSLTCVNDVVTLDGSTSLNAQNATFNWSGNFNGNPNAASVTVTEPGQISLVITDTLNGCTDMTTVDIIEYIVAPVADASSGGDTISCTNPSEGIGGINTSIGLNISYEWTSAPGGSITSDLDSAFTEVDAPGTYYLTVTNILSGCTATDSVVVIDNLVPLEAIAEPGGILNCQDSSFLLNASNSVVVPFANFQWQNSNGMVISDSLTYAVDYPDTFSFIIEFAFCSDTAQVVVSEGSVTPVANAGDNVSLDCDTGDVLLDGSGSDAGPDILYEWTTQNGVILTGATTQGPLVGAVGAYLLEVSDTSTFCSAFDTVVVDIDTIACMPVVDAGANGAVNCIFNVDTLVATASSGPNITYEWTWLPDSVMNVSDPFAPVLPAGTFVFAVTNEAVGLTAFDTVVVVADTVSPVANVGPFIQSLTCPELDTCYQLDASGSSQGPNFEYQWQSIDGSFCSDTDVLNAEILGQGVYNLQVTNTNNGCFSVDGVFIQLEDFLPTAVIDGGNVQMACGETETPLSSQAEPVGGDLSFEWFSPGGTIVSGGNTLTPQVAANNPQDEFFLVVTNESNLCTDTTAVTVFAPTNCIPGCSASVVGVLDCNSDTVTLSALGSSQGTDISYFWEAISGNLCGGATTQTACADEGGVYQLTVTSTTPSGAEFDSICQVEVEDLRQLPIADAGPDDNLNCIDDDLVLDGTGSSSGPPITYLWTTSNGNIINGNTTQEPLVDEPGTYELVVTDTVTGCFSADTLILGVDTLLPDADAGPGGLITCTNTSVLLDGSSSIPGMDFLWSTSTGNICDSPDQEDVEVCAAGTYYVTVTNPVNGCTATDSTLVDASSDFPEVDPGDNLSYTCSDTVFILNASASGAGPLSYQWEATNGGCIIGPVDVLQPTVACPGTYTLSVTDTISNCIAVAEVTVFDRTGPPIGNAGSNVEINCENPQVQLDAGGSMPFDSLDFEWSTSNGNILSGEMTATPTVDSAGLYQLIVTNQFTQCNDTAWVDVILDADIPVADAGPDTTLTCERTTLLLNGLGSDTGSDILYEWSGPGITGGENTLQPEINQEGTYTLTVSDTSSLCVVTDVVEVSLDTLSPTAVISNGPNLTIDCTTEQLTLSGAQSLPIDSVSWAWSTQDGSIVSGTNGANVVIDSGGTYILVVRHTRTGCVDEQSRVVAEDFEKPFIQVVNPPVLTCDSTSVRLEVIPPTPLPLYNFNWEGPGNITGANTARPRVDEPGLYQVTVTDTTNGCENEKTALVTEDLSQPDAVANALSSLDCDNLTALLSGEGSSTGAVTYRWTTNSTGVITTPNALTTLVDETGFYILTVRKLSNGCTASDTTQVTADAVPIDNVILSVDHPDCMDPEGFIYIDSVIGGTPPYTYILDNDLSIPYPQFSYLDPGAYELTVEGVNGCAWTTVVSVLLPDDIIVELGDDIYIDQGENAVLEAQLNISEDAVGMVNWTNLPDSSECPECLVQNVSPVETTTYQIQVFDTTGCWAMDDIRVVVNEELPFYVPTAFSPNGDNTNDRLIFYAGSKVVNIASFMIFDRWGTMVFQEEDFPPNNPNFGWDGNFEGRPLNPAVFVWKAVVEFVDGDEEEFYGEVILVR